MPPYHRILLKLSGEAAMGGESFGIDPATVARIAAEIRDVQEKGLEICLVIGGGNIFRGLAGASRGMERAAADTMGMLATIMNAIAMEDALGRAGVEARALSAIPMPAVCEPYLRRRALHHLRKGRVVLCAAGTGNPYFTTDTGAALRAAELSCDAIFKGTSVDGVYDRDPKKDAAARRYDRIGYGKVLGDRLAVMDATAVALCRDNAIPVVVFNIREQGNLGKVLAGQGLFTRIESD